MAVPGVAVASAERSSREGDRTAFGQLFERYSPPVFGFLWGLVGCRNLAEDLLQETFIRAFQGLPQLQDEAKFSTWLFGIARNVARERLRRERRESNRCRTLGTTVLSHLDWMNWGITLDPEVRMISRELVRAVWDGFAHLNEKRRMVLALRVLAERSYHEIAEITGWSLAKVKTEIYRARRKMRRWLQPFL